MWHASAALLGPGGPKPLAAWTPQERQRAETAIRRVLAGVGIDPSIEDPGRLALHVRRKVTPAEHAQVGPAIDVRPRR